MDHWRYWLEEQLVSGNNGLLVNLDINGFLGFTDLLKYTGSKLTSVTRVAIQLHFCTAECTAETATKATKANFEKDTCMNFPFCRHLL